ELRVARGEDRLEVFRKTEASHRHFCRDCGTPVIVRHPAMGMTDVPAGGVRGLDFKPSVHVHYQEKVLSVRDGLPKFKDFPKEFGGSGATLGGWSRGGGSPDFGPCAARGKVPGG